MKLRPVTKDEIVMKAIDIDGLARQLSRIAARLEGMNREAIVIDTDTEEALDAFNDSLDFLANRSREIKDAIDALVQRRWLSSKQTLSQPTRRHEDGDGCIISNPRAFDVTCPACMKGGK